MNLPPNEVAAWARTVFADEGGSRTLFPKLEDPVQLAELLAKLRGFARQQLAPRAARLRSVREILLGMEEKQRLEMFRGAMRRAMPWINAKFDRLGDSVPMRDRYKLYVAVEEGQAFGPKLANEVRQAIPASLGFQHCEIVSSGLRDRIVIYCELSGIPLDTMIPLGEEWRRCYRAERRGPLPLHNHFSATRFANPVVPSSEEIEKTRKDMGLFLRAVCYGILVRADGEQATYKLDLGYNDWVDIGSERDIRASGFDDSHLVSLRDSVDRFERPLTPIQVVAASVLLDWTGRPCLRPAQGLDRGQPQQSTPGLVNIVALDTAKTLLGRSKQMEGTAKLGAIEEVRRALLVNLSTWTRDVEGSLDDIDPFDANKDSDDDLSLRAVNKRVMCATSSPRTGLPPCCPPRLPSRLGSRWWGSPA